MRYDLQNEFNADASGRYSKTFVMLQQAGTTPALAWVDAAGGDYYVFYNEKLDKLVFERGVKPNTVFFETLLPESGWLQNLGASYYLCKLPQRQWKRSFCTNTHKLFPADNPNTLQQSKVPRLSGDSINVFSRMLERKTFEFSEAVENLTVGDFHSCALSNDICLSRAGLLFMQRDVIGKVAFSKRTFKYNTLFKDEVLDVVKTRNFMDVSKDEDN